MSNRFLFAAFSASLLFLLIFTGCHQLTNPLDPGSTAFGGEIVLRDPENAPLPEIVRWESVAEHAGVGYLALEILDAQYGEPNFFVEPRTPAEVRVVLTFSGPVYQETFEALLVLVAWNENGIERVSGVNSVQFLPDQRRVVFRFPGLTETTARIRIIDLSGDIVGERGFGLLRGDADGDGVVGPGDTDAIDLLDGQSVSTSESHVRADVDLDATVTSAGDGSVVSGTYNGDMLPGPPPSFDGTITTPTYTVTFDPNGGSAVAPQNVLDGGLVTQPADPVLAGYEFGGWFADDETFADAWDFGTRVVTAPTIIYAKWDVYSYTVTFNSDGGTPATALIDVDSPATTVGTLPTEPSRATFYFGGWWTETGGAGTEFTATTTVTAPITVYAFWSAVPTYTVNYDPNGGSPVAAETVPDGDLATDPGAPVRTGYTFGGWYADAGLTTPWTFATDTVTADITLYAAWTANSYDVVFDANGGVGAMPLQPVDYDETVALDASSFTRTGYSFDGWSLSLGGPLDYVDAASYTHTTDGNVILYARWIPNTYNIVFEAEGGTGAMADQPVDYDQTVTLNANAFTRVGYTFDGWSYTSGGSVDLGDAAAYTHTIAIDRTLYAVWSPVSYTVTYAGNGHTGGTPPVDTNYAAGATVTPAAPGSLIKLQDGISLRFTGWTQIGGGGGTREPGVDFTMPAESITLEAIWEVIGGTGPGGGLVFFDKGFISDGWRYLEAAPSASEFVAKWGDGTVETGAADTSIGAGKRNSARTISMLQNYDGGNYADMLVQGLSTGGFEDWYLPSRDELAEMYSALHASGWGGFDSVIYWSSSEGGATAGITFDFGSGTPNSEGKDIDERIRAIRAFRSAEPTHLVVYTENGADGGAVPVDLYHYEPGETATVLSSGALTFTGRTFAGWNTQPDDSGTFYPDGFGHSFIAGDENLILYARWSPFAGGYGTVGGPYQVATATHLDRVRDYPSAHFIQTANIDLGVSPWIDGQGWVPIGNTTTQFSGNYDGNDLDISNLTINAPFGQRFGLFGDVLGATLQNIRLPNAFLDGSSGAFTGPLAGYAQSTTITNVHGSGTVVGNTSAGGLVGLYNSGTMIESSASTIVSGNQRAGGLLGNSGGTVRRSYATGTVTGTGTSDGIGGFVGQNLGTIEDSYATGDVSGGDATRVGGFVGYNGAGLVRRSYSFGLVSGTTAIIGGFAGENVATINADAYYDSNASGHSDTGKGTPLTTGQMLHAANLVGFSFGTVWAIDEGLSYPYLQWQGGMNKPLPQGYVVGDTGPAGGIVFLDKGSYIDEWRYMEASPIDLGPTSWSTAIPFDVAGTTPETGAGPANTAALVAALNADSQTGRAAQLADDYDVNGFVDWFLPSRDGLQTMWSNLDGAGLLGSFGSTVYWSSTQTDSDNANGFNFGVGLVSNAGKTIATYGVRPARRF